METPKDSVYDKDIEANHYQTLAEALNHVNGVVYLDTIELSAIPSMKNIKRIEIKGKCDETTFDVNTGGVHESNPFDWIINLMTEIH